MNPKIKSQTLSIIYSLDRLILNDFIVCLVEYSEEYYHYCGEPLIFKSLLPKCDFDNIFNFYKKFLEKQENQESQDFMERVSNIIFPFDVFGSSDFLKSLANINNKHKDLINNFINKLKYHLLVDLKDFKTLEKAFRSIFNLRQSLVHGNNVEKYILKDSIKNLFLFIPNTTANELAQIISKKRGNKIDKIKNWAIKENSKLIVQLNTFEDKRELFFNLKTKKPNTKSIKNYNDFEYMRLCCFIGYFNIIKIKSIAKGIAKQNKDKNFYKNLNNAMKNITIEEIYKIYNLLLTLNTIITEKILIYYNQYKFENFKYIRNNILHSNIFFVSKTDNKKCYSKIFAEYLQGILDYLNYIIVNHNFDEKRKFITLKSEFMSAIYRTLCKKDYLILVITKNKGKKREVKEIQKISYEIDKANNDQLKVKIRQDTKISLRNNYIKKIKNAKKNNENSEFNIQKYYNLYSLKRSLIDEFKEIKNKDIEKFKNKYVFDKK